MSFGFGFGVPSQASAIGGATLNLNFIGSTTLDPKITFTRASTATYTDSAGLIASAAINAPRFDYDPVTLQPKGLLIEEQRTNRTLNSENFTAATWVATVVGTSTRVNDGAPLGFTRGLITATSATGGIRQVHSGLTSGQVYALSFYVQSTATSVQIVFENGTAQFGSVHNVTINPSNGTAGVLTGFTSVSIQPFGPGYVYTLITAPAGGALSANIEWRITNNGDSIWFGRPQFEAGAFATSYIPTVAAQVTRAADNAVMTGTNFSSWYNQSEGSFYAEILARGYVINEMLFSATDGTVTNPIQAYFDSATQIQTNAWGNGTVFRAATVGTQIKYALGIAVNNLSVTIDGAAVTSDTSVGPAVSYSQFNIGNRNSTLIFNGHIRSITYWPRRLSNAELQGVTA